jgi:hypothetical protein
MCLSGMEIELYIGEGKEKDRSGDGKERRGGLSDFLDDKLIGLSTKPNRP